MSTKGVSRSASRMRLESITARFFGAVALVGLPMMVACTQAGNLRAMLTFKQANQAYQTQDYKRAVELYEETVQNNPELSQVYFFLGNSYDNQYKPGVQTPENDAVLKKAIENYKIAAEKLKVGTPEDIKLRKLTLEYLVAAYASDKLNDPSQAEAVIQDMIRIDPGDPAPYYQLAKLYEDAGVYDEAEHILTAARNAKPTDPGVYMTLAGYYNRIGRFDKTIEALEQRAEKEPNNPEAFHTIGSYYWQEANRGDVRLQDTEKKDYLRKGLEAEDRALKIKPDYVEAVTFKGLLLRLQANVEKDPKKQQDLIKEATNLESEAEAIRKKKASGL